MNEQEEASLLANVLTFSKTGYSALYLVHAKSLTCSLDLGSCRKNWLHGNANISKSEYVERQI